MKSKAVAVFSLTAISLLGPIGKSAETRNQAGNWQVALPNYRYQFPRDYFSHPQFETEWWYYTGNLRARDGKRYGFELTFFRQGQRLNSELAEAESKTWRPGEVYLAHLALSDLDGQRFYHRERLAREGPGLAGVDETTGRIWNGNWQVRWTSLPGAKQELTAVSDAFTLKLELEPSKDAVIHGEDGVSRKGPAAGEASHYISFTRIAAKGTLERAAGGHAEVSGTAWMDHEFFSKPPRTGLTGWDWFAIQLDTGDELMLYRLRGKTPEVDRYSSGTYIERSGRTRFLKAADFELAPGEPWLSKETGARYPVRWQIRVPVLGLELEEKTDLEAQELPGGAANAPAYWEGAVRFSGARQGKPVAGVGYLEMTGYRAPVVLSGAGPQAATR